MMIRKIFLLITLVIIPFSVRSQADDFGIWGSLGAEYGLTGKTDLLISGSLRTFSNSSKIDEAFAEAGLHYSFSKYIEGSLAYRLTDRHEDDAGYYLRHKLFMAVRFSLPVNRLTMSSRLMLQRTSKTYIEDDADLDARYTGRLKIKSYYNTPSFPINPYVYAELFVPLYSGAGLTTAKNRFSGGAELKLNKHNSLELEYIFQRDYLPHIANEHIISVNYKFRF